MEKDLLINRIKSGTVIDHIAAGKATLIYSLLSLEKSGGSKLAILINTDSNRTGSKDIIKIDNRWLTPEELYYVALISPDATVNIIKSYKVTEKKKVVLPEVIEKVVRCQNGRCITNNDPEAHTKFRVISKDPIKLVCAYCNITIDANQIPSSIAATRS
jgi:aspartate carbamoyltransferase regulatory subunit